MGSPKPLSIGVMIPSAERLAPEAMCELASSAEVHGLDKIWHGDHVALPVIIESRYPYGGAAPVARWPFPDVFSTLSFAAARTPRIGIGTSVLVVPLRHPLSLAKSIATLDQLSGGRLTLGVGAGWLREEFEVLGYDYFDRRWQVLEEHLDVMQRLWRDGETEHSGAFSRFRAAVCNPGPQQPGGPPVLIGGKSKAARRLARKFGGWMPYRCEPEEIRSGLDEICRQDVSVVAAGVIRVQPDVESGDSWRIIGPVEHVAEQLRAYRYAGVTEFQMSDRWTRLREVFPYVPEIIALVNGGDLGQGGAVSEREGW